MTVKMMDLHAFVEKTPDADLLREMTGFAVERLMELEVGGMTGAGFGEKSPERSVQRNGYRDRDWHTRARHGRAAQSPGGALSSASGAPAKTSHCRRSASVGTGANAGCPCRLLARQRRCRSAAVIGWSKMGRRGMLIS